ncbi:MAG: hypothetical protein UX62_C0040G0004 [Microgenomates group bacterium GW2011_GWA2_46_7]|nr:MAG: hypothetical protein UX62_C0040G0004 [Microgenomates group bacterium GW2011_GWA2_46_7]
MNIQTISTKQLREDFSSVKTAMNAGQTLLLLYRSKPLAKISPVAQPKLKSRTFSKRQINEWIADDKLTPKQEQQIDAIINRFS